MTQIDREFRFQGHKTLASKYKMMNILKTKSNKNNVTLVP